MASNRIGTRRSASRAATFGSRMYRLFTRLEAPRTPRGIQIMNPYADRRVRRCVRVFLDRYFADEDERLLMFGINPGRFGAGITGITFTDPVALADSCGIPNHLPRRRELSSIFIYDVIDRLGGPGRFYRHVFLSAACPLGFTRDERNLNYYDDRELTRRFTPFIVSSIRRHIAAGGRRDHAVILGRGENMRFLERLNEREGFFEHLHALDHPRPIMQYRLKRKDEYVERYSELLGGLALSHR